MRLAQLKAPSQRDYEIYYAVVAHERTQTAVAEQHGLTQPRVSQIVGRVTRFIAEWAPVGNYSIKQQNYLALDTYNAALGGYAKLSHDTFVEQHSWCRDAEKAGATRRPPRADARLIGHAIAATKLQMENLEKLIPASDGLKEELLEREDISEDLEVQQLIGSCKDAAHKAKRFEKAGLQPPEMPELDEVALEVTIRNNMRAERRRERPEQCEQSELLPEAWRTAITAVYDAPVRKFGEPEPEPVAEDDLCKTDESAPKACDSHELDTNEYAYSSDGTSPDYAWQEPCATTERTPTPSPPPVKEEAAPTPNPTSPAKRPREVNPQSRIKYVNMTWPAPGSSKKKPRDPNAIIYYSNKD